MKELFTKIVNSTKYSLHGLCKAYKDDRSFKLEVNLGSIILIIVLFWLWPLTETQLLFILGSYALVLVIELVNTSMERILDKLHPQSDELIGLSKDIASAAVFLSIIFSFIVILIIALGKYNCISL